MRACVCLFLGNANLKETSLHDSASLRQRQATRKIETLFVRLKKYSLN